MTARARRGPVTLVTGVPQFTARRLVQELAGADHEARLALLVPERALAAAERLVAGLPGPRDRVQILEGEPRRIDLGLSGPEIEALAAEVSVIHHCAAAFHLGVDPDLVEAANVTGTTEVLELALRARELRQVVFYSTVGVSGDHQGVWSEDDFDRGQRFHNLYESTKFRAELALRAAPSLPLTVIRSSVVVGDSLTGEIDRYDGPYQLMLLFIALPIDLGLPLPGRATRLINLIPVDFFARASRVIAEHPSAIGRTFHVVDPEPLTMDRVFQLIALASERKAQRGFIPARITRALLRSPGFERVAESPLGALELFSADVVFSSRAAQEILREAGVVCPSFPEYVESLVGFLRQKIDGERARRGEEEVYDPLW